MADKLTGDLRGTAPGAETDEIPKTEYSLDPDDWEAFRPSAHAALDGAIDFLASARDRPVWRPVPGHVRAALAEDVPLHGQGLDRVYREFTELILPYSTGNTHPRFFGWVHG